MRSLGDKNTLIEPFWWNYTTDHSEGPTFKTM